MQSTSIAAESNHRSTTYAPASKLSLWCDRLIETGWLAAIIVVPLFFNIYSSRVFEPDKLTTLRSIALFMATAWIIKWFEERKNPNADRAITWRTPLVIPTLIMVVVYMISTALSVAPRTSLLGSYQRLQGTYTTFSYILVFFMVLQGLRTRAQLERLVTLLILNSLPIAFYGMLQRYQLDPLPWGGDTTERVAGNMGNAIFIAAYLIMAFFLTLIRIADAFIAVMTSEQARISDVVRAACYILIALLNSFVVLILSGSRGPQLGWLAGLFFSVLLLAQLIRKRTLRAGLTVGGIGLAGVVLAFLVLLNTSDAGFFQNMRTLPFFGRMGTAFNTNEGTNLVRVLIWKGAVNLVLPHNAIESPTIADGQSTLKPDAFNSLRPLFGYGPESMYVAYNRFYEPGLANVEARNASPDRSHNETWDSLVITGGVGFVSYMLLFGSIFYFGFLWIGLITSRFEKLLFPVLWIVGGLAGAVLVASSRPELFGIAVAGGVCGGIIVFMVISSLISAFRKSEDVPETRLSIRDRLLIIGILSTVIAHFVEIHTGIAIAATRSHFWILTAVMVVVGAGLLRRTEVTASEGDSLDVAPAVAPSTEPTKPTATTAELANSAAGRRRRRAASQAAASQTRGRTTSMRGFVLPDWFTAAAAYGAFLGLILGVMAFDFTNNSARLTVPGRVFVESMTLVKGEARAGVLFMFLLTLAVGLAIFLSEMRREGKLRSREEILAALGVIASISILLWVSFGTFIAGRLVDFVTTSANSVDTILNIANQLAAFPGYLYLLIVLVMAIGASVLRREEPNQPVKGLASVGTVGVGAVAALACLITVNTSNLQPIAADIVYKQANPWDQQGAQVLQQGTNVQGWDLAVEHYREAIRLAPNEDFYYLWLGRALLEKAKTTQAAPPTQSIKDNDAFTRVIGDGWGRNTANPLPSAVLGREDLLSAAKIILQEARVINPLNTDHSANLARMYRQSGDITQDAAIKKTRYDNSLKEYNVATSLSPQNAQLFNEWATLLYYGMNDREAAQAKLDASAALDKKFDQTYLIRGDILMQQAGQLQQAKIAAEQVLATTPATDTVKLAAAKDAVEKATQPWLDTLAKAEIEFTQVISINPKNTQGFTILAEIARQRGDLTKTISILEQVAGIAPNDWNTQKNLALLYRDNKQLDKAKAAAQLALNMAPPDQQQGLQALVQQLNAPQ
jgi:tetratricopeptide (TPR) repeat protein